MRFGRILRVLGLLALVASVLSVQQAGAQEGGDADRAGPPATPVDDDAAAGNTVETAAAPGGPDEYEQAAAANQALEDAAAPAAAAADVGATPIVPQSPGVPTIITEPDDNTAEPGGSGGPSVAVAVDAAPAAKVAPAAGAAAVDFGADVAVDTTTLSPYLQDVIGSSSNWRAVDLDVPALEAAAASSDVSLQLFPGVGVSVSSNWAPSPGEAGSTYWSGTNGSDFVMGTFFGDNFSGSASIDGEIYVIEPTGDGNHIVAVDGRPGLTDRENDDLSADANSFAADVAAAPAAGDGVEAPNAPAFPVVDIYMVYDTSTLNYYGSQLAADQAMVTLVNTVNTALDNTNDASLHVALVGVDYYNYPGIADGSPTYLNNLTGNGDGILDGVHGVRASINADLVHLMSDAVTDVCGVAWRPNSAAQFNAGNGFGLTDPSCNLPGLVVAHELGHNFGLNHDKPNASCWQNVPETCLYNDSFGYNTFSPSQRTIMSYNACGSSPCTRLPVFSDPQTTLSGWVTGVTGNQDNARVLEVTDTLVAAYLSGVGGLGVAGIDGISCAFATIEDAVSTAPAGSTIYIAPGTYPAQSSVLNYNISKDLDLEQGTSNCEPTTSGSASNVVLTLAAGSTSDAVLEVSAGATVRLERITIQGGNSAEGTMQVLTGADVTLDAAVVQNGNNPSATTGGGGVRITSATSSLTSINNSQIQNNSSSFGGGGVFIDDGTLLVNGIDDIDNNSAPDGGGIYAQNNATITLQANADVFSNSATSQGGGVYLDSSVLSATGSGTSIASNTGPTQGGGIYATNGSTATIGGFATISSNSAGFGGGAWFGGTGTEIQVDADGTVNSNTATTNGGGIMVSSSALADLNPGATVANNTATSLGGGLAVLGTATLDADGGTAGVDRVLIDNNTATDGGGIYSSGTSNLDTVHIEDNDADEGAGIYVTSAGTVNMLEGFSCTAGSFGFERYCNELSRNISTGVGSAVRVAGGTFNAVQAGFLSNSGPGAVIHATGASDVDVLASMFLLNDVTTNADGVITALDTSNINVVGVTFADNTEWALDSDTTGSTTFNVSRVISDNGAYGLGTSQTGSCNLRQSGGGGLPAEVTADPRFESNAFTDYMPAPRGPAADKCALLGGHNSDAMDLSVKDADGVASATEYDMGGIEADRQPLITPGAIGGPEGDSGITIFPVPVRLDIASSQTITIDYVSFDTGGVGIATANVDYIPVAGTVTFLPGETEKTVPVSVIGDTVPEVNAFLGEWLPLAFSNPSENAELNLGFFGIGLAIIGNDDGPPP